MYDYLIVGAGLFGSVFAYEAGKKGKSCLVVEKRDHIGGNIYTEEVEGINVHKYGAHIFHTSDKRIWQYMQQFAEFNRYTNSPVANYKGEIYNLPFNMNTFNKLWGVVTPNEAKDKIQKQVEAYRTSNPKNLEEQALNLVGKDIYEKLIKGYTAIIEKMLEKADVRLHIDYLSQKEELDKLAHKIVYTGPVDAYYDYCYGELEYRSVSFETEVLEEENYQGNAVVNYTEYEVPYTRIIEHKHFEFGTQEKTVISKEYPAAWKKGEEPYYPVNNEKNNALYQKYAALASKEEKVVFGGRLGTYRYMDMHNVVAEALRLALSVEI